MTFSVPEKFRIRTGRASSPSLSESRRSHVRLDKVLRT